MSNPTKSVVLVHGGFVDGSGWKGVYDILTADGFSVSVVQNPTLSLSGDDNATRQILDRQSEPAVLVGHSYGGAVISQAGNHDNVSALVYVTAFAPDDGESVNTLIGTFPTDGPQPPILPPEGGFLALDREKFHESFAGDLPAGEAAFMADSQVPWGLEALGGVVSQPAWRSKPSWYLVATDDRMIPAPAQRTMATRMGATIIETPGSHAVYVSRPQEVADVIKRAANEA
ncbi:alpha/beta hydrolase [Rhodococcus tukisamuensis]|uniref:Pimeloyl-ACP methyl ester carboxylesterase n=1 Tax=Rhodococcus tukisamuensis TaxID=168276 RepID=A0A1G6QEV3_9NOCA|nr:alpha/beta hydrolase [Rhodococcus tukisamuensis]SDC90909.1 Pimeloyl-ACP methyl ester carboxylesterase [Rhodococcus tukisamuensis]